MSRKKRASAKRAGRARSWRKLSSHEIEDLASEEPSVPDEISEPEEDSEDDWIEFCFDKATGRLEVSCERGSFGLVRDLIVGLCDVSKKIERDGVRIIEIRNADAIAERKERAPRLFTYGCLAAVLGLVVAAVIGVVTIIRWIIHR